MQYQRKIQILGTMIIILSVTLLSSFIFNPEARSVRQATGVLLDPKKIQNITKIEIKGPTKSALTFIKRTGLWYAIRDGKEYPVKNERIGDFLKPFSKPSFLPQRASSAQTHERLGLGTASASRVTFWGEDTEKPVLDMYFGSMDATGKEIYFRFSDSDSVKSIEDRFSSYIQSSPQSWYDLRIFPQSGNQGMKPELIQRIIWTLDSNVGFSISRSGPANWVGKEDNLEGKELDTNKIDTFLQDLINATGDDFTEITNQSAKVNQVTITAELGDGRTKKVTIRSDPETKSHWATSSDTPYTYTLSEWQYNRLVKERNYFIKSEK
ncbi:DUF4340 domain-containing protein [Gracilinema caldarium]|uniref:DUF4340 domain-containing protein n=1 Tax=Gracilinema caldarium (strain ATCC 51460 / DSM 7334 / H1) TaxID=744872 RepID=F8F2P1_GRAC1|nr:DUF4340 domain-containing protein [Gracilinema caldarium]AEJ19435.1 hypothetical protein Spica_1289 [Gracilinema caldarium DSM 7334]